MAIGRSEYRRGLYGSPSSLATLRFNRSATTFGVLCSDGSSCHATDFRFSSFSTPNVFNVSLSYRIEQGGLHAILRSHNILVGYEPSLARL